MHDDSADEPKPKRARGWLTFLGVMLAVGLIAYFGRSCLKHIVMGMPRSEAQVVLLGDRDPQMMCLCGMGRYPAPNIRVEYPEYGFDVIYYGEWRGVDGDTSDWKVIATEDRE